MRSNSFDIDFHFMIVLIVDDFSILLGFGRWLMGLFDYFFYIMMGEGSARVNHPLNIVKLKNA